MTDRPPPSRNGRAPTIRDVARQAGVAPGTVSNVLTGRKPVAEELRRAVLAAVEALRYRPNALASSLRLRQTRSIGIVVPDITNPFFAALIQHIEVLATREGFQMLLMSSHEDEAQDAERIRTLIARQIDGLLIAPSGDGIDEWLAAMVGAPPTLVLDRAFESASCDTVAADNVQGAYEGARYLLGLGHRDVAVLATSDALANVRDRVEGFRAAFAEAGSAARIRLVFGGMGVESCRAAIEEELRRADRPTAIFSAAYVATLGAVKAIRAVELDFPRDISLLGFDDTDWMTVLRPYITTIGQPVRAMAEQAWTLLHTRLAGDDGSPVHRRLPCTLHVRESTVPV